jgi:anti-anti-sigma factor
VSTTDLDFEVTESAHGATRVIGVRGELDVSTSSVLQSRLLALADGEGLFVVLDLSGVSFVDSTALNTFLVARARFRATGGDVHLVVTAPNILKVLEITALDEVLAIYPSVTEAVQAVEARA